MKIIDHGPWAGTSAELAATLRELTQTHQTSDGLCIRGPFVIDVTHKSLTPRALPQKYLEAELAWFHTASDNVADLASHYGKIPKEWMRVAAADGTINGQYGWCIWSQDTGYQYRNALNLLHSTAPREGRESRRAIMVYTHRNFHDWATRKGAADPMCTISAQVQWVPPGKLHYIATMRATDAVFGYTADTNWHHHLMFEHLLPDLDTGWRRAEPRMSLVTACIQVYGDYMKMMADTAQATHRYDMRLSRIQPCAIEGEYGTSIKGFAA